MATTDFDGTPLLIIGEGRSLVLVIGDRSYQGTLQFHKNGFTEDWYIRLINIAPGEPDEILIHKVEKDSTPDTKPEPEGSN